MRARQTIPLFALIGLAVAVPALAQVKPGDPLPAACSPDPAKTDRAHETYKIGKTFFDRGEYDKALQYWSDAYGFDCSAHFLLPRIADIWQLKGNKQEALRVLEEYMKRTDGAKDSSTVELRAAVQVRIDNLRKDLAAAPPPSSAAPPPTAPTASATAPASTTAAPPPPPSATSTETVQATTGGHSVTPWVVVGIGGAAVIAGGIFVVLGSSKVSTAESHCANRVCTSSQDVSDGNSGRSMETTGVIIGAVGVAAVAGGLIWHFMEPANKQPTAGSRKPRVTPQVAPGYAGIGVGGSF
jgi:hypothetical protein